MPPLDNYFSPGFLNILVMADPGFDMLYHMFDINFNQVYVFMK